MRRVSLQLVSGILSTALIFGAGYAWYEIAYSKCDVPVLYDIGTIDERFGITRDEVKSVVTDAESLWEDSTGKNLFTYTPGADFTINFVYDERQSVTEDQHELSEVLEQKAEMSESIKSDYDKLIASYDVLKKTYEEKVTAYEKKLKDHNEMVGYWNKKGGAPEATFKELEAARAVLNKESASLNALTRNLNDLAKKINQIGEKGNNVVEDYNKNVSLFNNRFNHDREFTQGDYQGSNINIYQYDDRDELRRVLAHEFGHALSLGHVEEPTAIMYSVMEGKNADFALKYEDLMEYRNVCGTR